MGNADKLSELVDLCKAGIHLIINEHRNYYMSAAERLEELGGLECPPEYTDFVRDKMIETDTIVDLQFYPDTPVGFHHILHYDVSAALEDAIDCVEERRRGNK